ncbi:hypothetical protein M5K25_009283 [Dendrobium thyrsiflorum]|uniref:Uncharacterized protein n=1 Tax=Dendrobium thyrsiflorum TaxID=117978 RepID=A0ABD0VC31_DENTH
MAEEAFEWEEEGSLTASKLRSCSRSNCRNFRFNRKERRRLSEVGRQGGSSEESKSSNHEMAEEAHGREKLPSLFASSPCCLPIKMSKLLIRRERRVVEGAKSFGSKAARESEG